MLCGAAPSLATAPLPLGTRTEPRAFEARTLPSTTVSVLSLPVTRSANSVPSMVALI